MRALEKRDDAVKKRDAVQKLRRAEKAVNGRPPERQRREKADRSPAEPESNVVRSDGAAPKFFKCTDLGNAERLLHHHGQDLRHVADIGWHAWTGHHWELDRTGEVLRRAKQTARSIYQEAANATDPNMRKAIADWAKSSESAAKLKSMVELAKTEKQAAITTDHLDQNHDLLNVQNGTLDLRTGKLRAHDPRDLITRWVKVPYVETAECPRWLAFLERVLGGDAELISFVQNWLGYCLTGDVSEQALVFFYGSGANGKSTLLTVLLDLLGGYAGYARSAAPDLLLAKQKGADHPCDIADLRGARLVICQEVESGRAFAEVVVKQLTGGDRIKARFMRQDFFEFSPTHKLVIAANCKPIVRGTDHAIWRRIRLVPFDVTISDDEKDPQLVDKLRTELTGILRWCVEGCLAWRRSGLGEPASVKQATTDYRNEMDIVGTFITECCLVDRAVRSQSSQLYTAYSEWCETNGEKPVAQKRFGGSLRERGFESEKVGTVFWNGIGLLQSGPFGRFGPRSHINEISLGTRGENPEFGPEGPEGPARGNGGLS